MSQLERMRYDRGWTAEELGRKAGVAGMTVRRIEANGQRPTPAVAKKLADALETTPTDLFMDPEDVAA